MINQKQVSNVKFFMSGVLCNPDVIFMLWEC